MNSGFPSLLYGTDLLLGSIMYTSSCIFSYGFIGNSQFYCIVRFEFYKYIDKYINQNTI